MTKSIICRRMHGHLMGLSGEWLEMSDGSLWFHPDSGGTPVCQYPRNPEIAMSLAALDPETTGEFDQADWDNGGDGRVYR